MAEDVCKLIGTKPFAPFIIYTTDGKVLRVPTVDHVAVPPAGNRIFIFGDNGDYSVFSPLLIDRISMDRGESGM